MDDEARKAAELLASYQSNDPYWPPLCTRRHYNYNGPRNSQRCKRHATHILREEPDALNGQVIHFWCRLCLIEKRIANGGEDRGEVLMIQDLTPAETIRYHDIYYLFNGETLDE